MAVLPSQRTYTCTPLGSPSSISKYAGGNVRVHPEEDLKEYRTEVSQEKGLFVPFRASSIPAISFIILSILAADRCSFEAVSSNPLTPNDPYRGRTAPLTSKLYILYIYSSNIGTEYFKHGIYSPFFSLQNAVCFIILTYFVPVLFTFYIQDVLKLKINNSGAKRLTS